MVRNLILTVDSFHLNILSGLCVARVRVIFKLPEAFGNYPNSLAYVDWFKPLREPVSNLAMHHISLSSQMHRQRSSVIPGTDIVRTCHLIPLFGRTIDRSWSTDNVLDIAPSFYLNPYLRHHDFFLLRYLVDLRTARKAVEDRDTRIRVFGRAGR